MVPKTGYDYRGASQVHIYFLHEIVSRPKFDKIPHWTEQGLNMSQILLACWDRKPVLL